MAAFKLVKAEATGREYVSVELPEYAAYGRAVYVAPDRETLTYVGNALLEAAKTAGKLQKGPKAPKATKTAGAPVALDIAALVAAGFSKAEITALILGSAGTPATVNGAVLTSVDTSA